MTAGCKMTKCKLCGLFRPCDIAAANKLRPDYIGFVFTKASSRFVTDRQACALKSQLHPSIPSVGVFVDESPQRIAGLVREGIIDLIQLHGRETESYLQQLRMLTDAPIIQAFRIRDDSDVRKAQKSTADLILLDAGAGDGKQFDWQLVKQVNRPYFLAGGLTPENVEAAIKKLHPYAVDVSSGVETEGRKDQEKMAAFMAAVRRKEETHDE